MKNQRDSLIVFTGALQVLMAKGLVNNDEIKKAIEETLATAGKSGSGSSATSPGESNGGVPDSKKSGDVAGVAAIAASGADKPVDSVT